MNAIDLAISTAWHTAMFERQQKLKGLREILAREPERPQTDDELWLAAERWVSMHNAKYAKEAMNG